MTHVAAPPVDAPTEARNPRTLLIDTLSTLDILRLLNAEDALVAAAVERNDATRLPL
jgi:N-acetylmuramic acid 6-phosphate (MurNAc-6-P) etherase